MLMFEPRRKIGLVRNINRSKVFNSPRFTFFAGRIFSDNSVFLVLAHAPGEFAEIANVNQLKSNDC